MVFSSLQFLLIFMPVFFGCYYLTPQRWQNAVLLIGSLVFYLIGTLRHPWQFILLLLSIGADYGIGLWMERYPARKKFLCAGGVLLHIALLGVFKYGNFVLGEMNRLVPGFHSAADIALPIGISFYTFQGISYLCDVYREKTPAEKSLLRYGVYISMFPQLIAGPIVTYNQVQQSLYRRTVTLSGVLRGVGTFIFGLGLKVLLANPLGKLWSQTCAIGFDSISTPLSWLAIIAFSFQIYFDFFGYSLMATGLGAMLGFTLPQNFDHPYTSLTMTEFWRRWHMTLGNWFRDYVYIPLGGNRNGRIATIRNLLTVWLLTGLWHGAGYNFILWGIVLCGVILLEKFLLGTCLRRLPLLGHLYMLLLIPVTWAIFAIGDPEQLGIFFTRLFPFFGQNSGAIFPTDYLKYLRLYSPFLMAAALFSTRWPYRLLNRLKNPIVTGVFLAAVLGGAMYCLYRGFDDPFLYFRF